MLGTNHPADVLVKDLERFVPGIEGVPQENEKDKRGIVVVCKYCVPVDGTTGGVESRMEGSGGRRAVV